MKSSTEDPWRELSAQARDDDVIGRRVDHNGRYDFFWARDPDGNVLLILKLSMARPSASLPHLHGLRVSVVERSGGGGSMVVWRLVVADHAELFRELCLDVIRAAEASGDEAAAAATAIARTWRWHHLLRGGRPDRLSVPEQLGLVTELLVLETLVIPGMGALAGVRAWRGPLGDAQDFRIRDGAVEVKARTTTGVGTVRIHSAEQLDESALGGPLWLVVGTLDGTTSGTGNAHAVTLDALVARVRRSIDSDSAAFDLMESLLTAAGYSGGGQYSDREWVTDHLDVYRVEGSFPRLTPASLPVGVGRVEYALALASCSAFMVDIGVVQAWVWAGADV